MSSDKIASLRIDLMNIYWICALPFFLWMSSLVLAADRINSFRTAVLFDLAATVCLVLGVILFRHRAFHEKPGFFVVVFAVPFIYLACFEFFRLVYKSLRHEVPCINVRSGRRIGDRPVDGFYTTYPSGKLISWADVLFGISQMMIPVVIILVLFICSLELNW